MTDFVTAAKALHRRNAVDQFSKSDKKQASSKLKEATTKGETLNEWFEKKKSGKDCDARMTPSDGDLIPINDASYATEIQQKKNSIAEGKMLLRGKKKSSGAKYSDAELAAIQRSVEKQEKELRDLEEKESK